MIQLRGPAALSAFRLAKLKSLVGAAVPAVRALSARFAHFVDLERGLTAAERVVLDALLQYGPQETASQADATGAAVLELRVVPRPGTISPWSSMISARCVVLVPGAAHISQTRSPAAGASRGAARIAVKSCGVNSPVVKPGICGIAGPDTRRNASG